MTFQAVENGIELLVKKKGLFSKGDNIDKAIGLLESYADETPELCQFLDENKYFITHELLAELSDYEMIVLGLPRSIPYKIHIETEADLGSEKYSINWHIYEGNQPRYFKRVGALLIDYDETYRLPSDMLQILEVIDKYNENDNPTFDDNLNASAELKSLLPEENELPLNVGRFFSSIQLKHASAFSLKITGDKNSLNFDPVLFNKKIKQKATDSDYPIEEDEQIFSESESAQFLADFDSNETIKPTYIVGARNYVYIDKSLRPALVAVKKAKRLDQKQRENFIKSPQKYIKEVLEKDIIENDPKGDMFSESIDKLFIETRQYSDRVTEIGIWKRPSLPVKDYENEWTDENYHFYIQGHILIIKPCELEESAEKITDALNSDDEIVQIGGVDIKPDKAFLETLNDLIPKKPERPENGNNPPEKMRGSDASSKETFVLMTKANFETVQYNNKFSHRKSPLPTSLSQEELTFLSHNTKLKKHQKVGVQWLVDTYNRGFPGVLMADDMGLGKTLQALTFLALLVESGKTEKGNPILIVAPVSLLKNWEEEHAKHLKGRGLGNFLKLHGRNLNEVRVENKKDIELGSAILETKTLKQCDWILTTYETLRDYHISLAEIKFSCIVFDELQKAKNPRSSISHSTTTLNKDFSIGLTGTPVENSLVDLWTIMDILSPGRLGDLKTFAKNYPEPYSDNQEEAIEKLRELAGKLLKPTPAKDPAPVLRRMKSDLLDSSLPKKIIIPPDETTLSMSENQEIAYTDISNKLKSGHILMIQALQSFRKVSLHPVNPLQKEHENYSDSDYISFSARFRKTFEILDQIKLQGEKVLIFLESLDMQPLLADIIKQRYSLASRPLIINGAVSGDARQKRVNQFQQSDSDFDVMIISPKAGGIGLTLTAANNVIHLERWWNPAVEDQCTDRTYRIGQTKNVKVYTPIAESKSFGSKSFDCVLDKLLESKRTLAKELFIPTTIRSKDWEDIFRPENGDRKLSLEDIDCYESGQDFEYFVRTLLQKHGLRTSLTPASHDYGADLIAENRKTGKTAILQCKHRSSKDKAISESAVKEVLRAAKNYDIKNPKLLIVSNVTRLTRGARSQIESQNIKAILRNELLDTGKIVKDHLS